MLIYCIYSLFVHSKFLLCQLLYFESKVYSRKSRKVVYDIFKEEYCDSLLKF